MPFILMVQKIDFSVSVSLAICDSFQIEIRAPAMEFSGLILTQGLHPWLVQDAPLELSLRECDLCAFIQRSSG